MLTSIVFLLMLSFMTRSLGPLTEGITNLTALVLFIFFVFRYRPLGAEVGIFKWLSLTISCVILAILVTHIPDDVGRLVGISTVVMLLELGHRFLGRGTGELPVFALTSLLYSFTLFVHRYVPEVWWLSQKFSTTISSFVAGLLQRGPVLGPSALGYDILCAFAMLYLSAFLFSQRRNTTTLIMMILSLIGAEIVFLIIYPFISSLIMHFWSQLPPHTLYLQFLLFLLLLAPTFFYFRNMEFRKMPVIFPRSSLKCLSMGALFLLFSCGLLSTSLVVGNKGQITFYEQGLLDWRIPVFGVYGQQRGAMFGLLTGYLEAKGYNTAKISTATEENLAQSNVLVMINLNSAISDKEKQSIWNYVRNGGSLLLLGDHTNVAGLMDNFNDLLESAPVKFRFDSAYFSKYGWRDSLGFLPHPTTYRLKDETEVQLWVGASLDCQPPSSPVIMGRYAYSDSGDPLNAQEAFLGNRRLDPGEQLGDVVLAAEFRYGKGKVLVFGDTSPFQNVSLLATNEFIDGVFHWLISKEIPGRETWLKILAGVGFVLAAVFLSRRGWCLTTLIICGAVLSLAIAAPRITQGGEADEEIRANVAYIDYSHTERFDLMTWDEDSIGGLSNNLTRNGFMPFLLRDFSKAKLSRARLLVLIAPAKPFQKREIDEIKAFVEHGGTMVISVGWEEGEAVAPLLESMGLYLSNVPLGPAQVERGDYKVKFHEAWPIVYREGRTKVVAQQWGYPIVVEQRLDKGRIIAIGDSYFLLNQNLEGSRVYNLGNIALLREILQEDSLK